MRDRQRNKSQEVTLAQGKGCRKQIWGKSDTKKVHEGIKGGQDHKAKCVGLSDLFALMQKG